MNIQIEEMISLFVILWAVVDPIGTVPVFIAITKNYTEKEKIQIATSSSIIATCILLFFLIVGEFVLKHVGVPLAAFQTSGGVILFLFATNMIFGSSKPEEEIQLLKKGSETAIFPLAIPSIASPGAILAVVLLADSDRHSIFNQAKIAVVLLVILLANYMMMRLANKIHKQIGDFGAVVISKVMGLILASMAANNILMGIKTFFRINS